MIILVYAAFLTFCFIKCNYQGFFLGGVGMQAFEMADSIQSNWKHITGREPSARMILTKANILMRLEEWRELIKTTEECFFIHKRNIDDRIAAIMSDHLLRPCDRKIRARVITFSVPVTTRLRRKNHDRKPVRSRALQALSRTNLIEPIIKPTEY